MRRDLALVAALALAGLLAAVLQAPVVVRAVLLVPLALVLPGYAIAANLFARGSIGSIERAVYSVTLSIAVVAVGGLLIQLVLGLGRDVWAVFLAAVTISAALRLRGEAPGEPIAWPRAIPWPLPVAILAFILAGVIAALAIASAGDGLREAQAKIRFTDFWLIPDGAGPSPGSEQLEVGLRSHEGRPVHFGLQLSRSGRVISSQSLELRGGEERKRTFLVAKAPRGVPVLATLTREGKPYRRLDVVPPR
jgi:uncharacterized membrane protein